MMHKQPLKKLLEHLIERTGALTLFLITKEGISLASAGDTSYLNEDAVAALVAGMFSATHEVARMVGEEHFSIILQQGERRHIHVSLVNPSVMIVIIFEDHQRIGRVRHEAKRNNDAIAEQLTLLRDSSALKEEFSVPEFKAFALNVIDQLFLAE